MNLKNNPFSLVNGQTGLLLDGRVNRQANMLLSSTRGRFLAKCMVENLAFCKRDPTISQLVEGQTILVPLKQTSYKEFFSKQT